MTVETALNGAPRVVDGSADQRFRDRARALGWDPDERFVGGYVEWEWQRSRHAFDHLLAPLRGKRVLEFGCHLAGTAIVLAALGAEVTGIDVHDAYIELARLNAERHGLGGHVRVEHVPDTTRLPFPDRAFDVVSCNSVLEYVPAEILAAVQREIDRVLAPGGLVIILGTSNRLWPKELHSSRWLVNYVPRQLQERVVGQRVESVSPWRLRRGFPGYTDLALRDQGQVLLELKERMGVRGLRRRILGAANQVLLPLGAHVGFVSPTITLLLQKPEAGAR